MKRKAPEGKLATRTAPTAIEKKIVKLEGDLKKAKERLAALRAKVKPRPVENFCLTDSNGQDIWVADLFGKKNELILVHNMGIACAYCTLWADGFNGVLKHLENRAAFAVESPDMPQALRKFGKARGWQFQYISSAGTPLKRDLGFEDQEGYAIPGVSTLSKDSRGRIVQNSHTVFGPGDNYCAVWDLFDLLPSKTHWEPRFRY